MAEQQRPNIVITMADDQRHDTIGALGHPHVKTPHLDALTRRGTTMRRTYIQGSTHPAVCAPSRAMLHSGRNLFDLPDEMIGPNEPARYRPQRIDRAPLLGEVLRDHGYHNFVTGKWHNGKHTLARSFDDGAAIFFGGMCDHDKTPVHDFDPTGAFPDDQSRIGEKFSTDLFTDAAVDFLDGYDRDQPFFLCVTYTAPHDPRMPPKEYADMYEPRSLPLPDNFMAEHPFDNGELDIRDEKLADRPRDPETVREHIAAYYGMISHMDAGIGRVHEALERNGFDENTIVIHTADHGLAVGQHGLLGKQNMYDHSMRVPMTIAGPGVPENGQSEALVYLHDLYPTLCQWLDMPVPGTCQGHSFLTALAGEAEHHRDSIFSAYKDEQRMVFDGRHKLIRYEVGGSVRQQLFDLETDPSELRDLSEDPAHREIVTRLEYELDRWRRHAGDQTIAGAPLASGEG